LETGSLPRRLNLIDAVTIAVGSMIGSGVFLKASSMCALLPHPLWLLLAWLLSGLLTLCGALTLAELSVRFPHTGAPYVYLKEAYGPLCAYLFAWSLLAIMETGSIAGLAAGSSLALSRVWQIDEGQQILLAHAMIWSLTLIHCFSVRVGITILQNLFTLAKGVGILTVIVLGLNCPTGSWSNLQGSGPLPEPVTLIGIMGLLMMKALWGYDGWINATYVSGELKDPKSQVPRALIGGSLLVMVLYCATNLAFHYSLPPSALAASKMAAADVMQQCAGPQALVFISYLIAFSMFGTLNGSIMSAPRVYFAMAPDVYFFRRISTIHHRFQTPYVALLVQAVWSSVLLFQWKNFERITDNVMFVYWIFYALGAAAVFRFAPLKGSYVTPFRPITAGIFIATAIFLTLNTLWHDPANSAQALVLIGVGLVVYRLSQRAER
jgi:amino acid transporter